MIVEKIWILAVVIGIVAILIPSCDATMSAALESLNAASAFGNSAIVAIESSYESELQSVIKNDSLSREEKQERVDDIRLRYHDYFVAYRIFRAQWMLAATAVKIAQDSGSNAAMQSALANVDTIAKQQLRLQSYLAQLEGSP